MKEKPRNWGGASLRFAIKSKNTEKVHGPVKENSVPIRKNPRGEELMETASPIESK